MPTSEEIEKQIAALQQEYTRIRSEELEAALVDVKEKVAKFKIPLAELYPEEAAQLEQLKEECELLRATSAQFEGGIPVRIDKRKLKVPPKYRDPKTGATWSGRGREPAWIEGKNRAKFEIK